MYIPCFTVTIVLKMERKQGRKSSLGSFWKGWGRGGRLGGEGGRGEEREVWVQESRNFSIEGYQQPGPQQQGDKRRLQRTSEEKLV